MANLTSKELSALEESLSVEQNLVKEIQVVCTAVHRSPDPHQV